MEDFDNGDITEWRDQIFETDTKIFSRPIPRPIPRLFFETKCFWYRYRAFFCDQLFLRPILRLFLRPNFLRPRLRFFRDLNLWDQYRDFFRYDMDSGFGWEFSQIWIPLSCKMDLSKFYVLSAHCQKSKLKFNQDSKASRSFCFELKVLNESNFLMPWVR